MTKGDTTRSAFAVKSFRLTREGKWFILLLCGVGVAALNTANNLLYLVFSLKLCLLIVQIVLCRLNTKKMSLRRTAQRRATAGEGFPVTLHITCRNKRLPMFSIQVRDIIDGAPFKRSGHFLKANADETRHIEYLCERPLRGRTHFDGIVISSAFPFGLTERVRFVKLPHDMIIWPAQVQVHLPRQYTSLREGSVPVSWRGSSEDFWQLREFKTGDDERRISWKASARQRRLIMLETAAHTHQHVQLALDLGSVTAPEEKEILIRIAASLTDLLHRRKIPVIFFNIGGDIIECATDSCNGILDHLALLSLTDDAALSVPMLRAGTLVISAATAADFLRQHPGDDPLDTGRRVVRQPQSQLQTGDQSRTSKERPL
ncbi:MAG: DUF58 domain-containing protein [Deltaproteobacteria bacterium]|nr:DUF58 domain-containing protein [Deltaproteobacteria bacterium]